MTKSLFETLLLSCSILSNRMYCPRLDWG